MILRLNKNLKAMNDYKDIKTLLLQFASLGIKKSNPTGALLIGKAPHIAENAWLNRIYPEVGEDEIITMEKEINKIIPTSYVDFLTKFSNGLNVLGDTLCLFGYRANLARTEELSWQPFSLISLNRYDKPKNSTDDMFFIGSYDWDGSLLYITPDEQVHFCRPNDSTSLFTWNTFHSMLTNEIKRLYLNFDSLGIQINDSLPTTPV